MNYNRELLKSIFLDAQNKTSRMAKLNFLKTDDKTKTMCFKAKVNAAIQAM